MVSLQGTPLGVNWNYLPGIPLQDGCFIATQLGVQPAHSPAALKESRSLDISVVRSGWVTSN
jgi:hypothetical protein